MRLKMQNTGKNMKDCLIIGRSPFLNKINLDEIHWDRFYVICINYPVPDIPVDCVIAHDWEPEPVLAPATEFISPRTGYFLPNSPIEKQIAFECYTSTSAVDFAFRRGFKRVFLIGIDHIEDNKPFLHYDGIQNKRIAPAENNRKAKAFICSYKNKMSIYQTNPSVQNNWDLPFADISTLSV